MTILFFFLYSTFTFRFILFGDGECVCLGSIWTLYSTLLHHYVCNTRCVYCICSMENGMNKQSRNDSKVKEHVTWTLCNTHVYTHAHISKLTASLHHRHTRTQTFTPETQMQRTNERASERANERTKNNLLCRELWAGYPFLRHQL